MSLEVESFDFRWCIQIQIMHKNKKISLLYHTIKIIYFSSRLKVFYGSDFHMQLGQGYENNNNDSNF